jgi:hypothetical protein
MCVARILGLVAAMVLAGHPAFASAVALEPAPAGSGAFNAAPETTPSRAVRRFHVREDDERSKFQTYAPTLSKWTPAVIHWRYNDAGRNPAIVGASTAAETLASIQSAMAVWSSVCNISFVYAGTTSATPGVLFDGVSTIGWYSDAPPTTGITSIAGSGSGPPFPITEADIELNASWNPSLSTTLLHEIGHMLGLDHSDVSNVMMSGPPLTPYSAVGTLQPDDIAGCVALYGAPVPPSISGTITQPGGAPLPGVTFCAVPSSGVSCTPSNGSGVYTCAVPAGWSGTLHSPRVGGLRIPPQRFTTSITSTTTRNVTAVSDASFPCNLDIDDNGLVEPDRDGVAILRRLLGFPETVFSGLAGACATRTAPSSLFAAAGTGSFAVTGASQTRAASDGLILVRAMRGAAGSGVTGGVGFQPDATRTSWSGAGQIQDWLNTTCGYVHQPIP